MTTTPDIVARLKARALITAHWLTLRDGPIDLEALAECIIAKKGKA